MVLISSISPQDALFFNVTVLGWTVLPFGFSHYESSYVTGKEPVWVFCQLQSMSISIIHLGTAK